MVEVRSFKRPTAVITIGLASLDAELMLMGSMNTTSCNHPKLSVALVLAPESDCILIKILLDVEVALLVFMLV